MEEVETIAERGRDEDHFGDGLGAWVGGLALAEIDGPKDPVVRQDPGIVFTIDRWKIDQEVSEILLGDPSHGIGGQKDRIRAAVIAAALIVRRQGAQDESQGLVSVLDKARGRGIQGVGGKERSEGLLQSLCGEDAIFGVVGSEVGIWRRGEARGCDRQDKGWAPKRRQDRGDRDPFVEDMPDAFGVCAIAMRRKLDSVAVDRTALPCVPHKMSRSERKGFGFR